MALRPRNGLSLCSGGGGLDMGLMLAEPGFHTRCFVEWEEYPRQTLIAAQRAGYFAPAPIYGDLTTFDAKPFAGAFDTLLAGYPCQPFSQAGQRKGEDDERHLWPDIARIITELGPALQWVFLENVAGHVSLGAETVLRALRDMGFTPAVGLFSREEVGAPHQRLRWFCVAYRPSEGCEIGRQSRQPTTSAEAGTGLVAESERCGGANELAHANGGNTSAERQQRSGQLGFQQEGRRHSSDTLENPGCAERRTEPAPRNNSNGHDTKRAESDDRAGEPIGELADASEARSQGEQPSERYQDKRQITSGSTRPRSGAGLFPPGPSDASAWIDTITMAPDLAPSVAYCDIARRANKLAQMVEAGKLAEAQAESELRFMVDGLAQRSRALRLLGNGVCSLAAGYAWRTLSAAHGLSSVDMGTTCEEASHEAD